MGGAEAGTPDIGKMFGAGSANRFLGVPSCPADDLQGARVAILGADGATPYASVGAYCAGGPAAIRAAASGYAGYRGNVNFDLGRSGWAEGDVVDCGDLPFDAQDHGANRAAIADSTSAIMDQGAVPLLLGGDDSVPTPLIAQAAAQGPLTILQIDAHIDWRDEVEGEALGLSSTMRRASELAGVERIIQVGQRGIGSARMGDFEDATRWGVSFFPAEQVSRNGIEPVLGALPEGGRVLIALDVDALDPAIMPAAIGRTPGGLSYWDVIGLVRGAAARSDVVAMDVVEFMPARDIDGLGAMLVAGLVAASAGILAQQALGPA